MSFINPVKGSSVNKDGFSKKVKIKSFTPNDFVLSPYDGEIIEISNKCDGNMVIKHDVDGDIYYSNFCKIQPSTNLTGIKVSKGQKIGTINGETLLYYLEDESGDKKDLDYFMFGSTQKSDKKNDKESDKKSSNKIELPKSSKYPERIGGSVLRGLLSPFGVINKMLNPKKEEDNLKEEINRIKELLK
jgi:hypothetical protein